MPFSGRIVQLVRTLLSHGRGHRFESCCVHHFKEYEGHRFAGVPRLFSARSVGSVGSLPSLLRPFCFPGGGSIGGGKRVIELPKEKREGAECGGRH